VFGPFSAVVEHYQAKQTRENGGSPINCRISYRSSTWYRSGTASNHSGAPLPYSMSSGRVTNTYGVNQTCDAANELGRSTLSDSRWNNLKAGVSNRALAKMIAKAQADASAGLGETLAEWGQAQDMLVKRLTSIWQALRALRRLDPRGVGRALGLSLSPKMKKSVRNGAKSVGDKWLELHLGWEPLINDIYGTCEQLSREFEPITARGSAHAYDRYETVQNLTLSKNTKGAGIYVGHRCQCDTRVINPNQALLASLGLINPVQVAWNSVPYSFVVDWFVDLSGFIGGLDGLAGLDVSRAFHSELLLGTGRYVAFNRLSVNSPWVNSGSINSTGCKMTRSLGLPPYHFVYPTMPKFSWQRSATAIALVLQFL
jgi:hypothetical protein